MLASLSRPLSCYIHFDFEVSGVVSLGRGRKISPKFCCPKLGKGPPAEPRHEVFSLKFLQFCCAGPWEFRAEVFAEVFFLL